MFAFIIKELGNLESIQMVDIPKPTKMHPESLLIDQTAFGLSYDDIAIAKNTYNVDYSTYLNKMGNILGLEATGVVRKVGSRAGNFAVGDRVAYCLGSIGAFCEQRVIHNSVAVKIPPQLSDVQVVASFRKLIWVHTLLYRITSVHQGWHILIHNVADPLEAILCQIAKSVSLSVIGSVNNAKEYAEAIKLGCNLVLQKNISNSYDEIFKFTNGQGVRLVYDSIGNNSVETSIECMQHLGTYIAYQTKSGVDVIMDTPLLASKSLSFVCPSLEHYKSNKSEFAVGADAAMGVLLSNVITPTIETTNIRNLKSAILAINNGQMKDNIVFLR